MYTYFFLSFYLIIDKIDLDSHYSINRIVYVSRMIPYIEYTSRIYIFIHIYIIYIYIYLYILISILRSSSLTQFDIFISLSFSLGYSIPYGKLLIPIILFFLYSRLALKTENTIQITRFILAFPLAKRRRKTPFLFYFFLFFRFPVYNFYKAQILCATCSTWKLCQRKESRKRVIGVAFY